MHGADWKEGSQRRERKTAKRAANLSTKIYFSHVGWSAPSFELFRADKQWNASVQSEFVFRRLENFPTASAWVSAGECPKFWINCSSKQQRVELEAVLQSMSGWRLSAFDAITDTRQTHWSALWLIDANDTHKKQFITLFLWICTRLSSAWSLTAHGVIHIAAESPKNVFIFAFFCALTRN